MRTQPIRSFCISILRCRFKEFTEALQGEMFYMIFSYILFVIICFGLDSRRELILFSARREYCSLLWR
jgi:hypothetical protein